MHLYPRCRAATWKYIYMLPEWKVQMHQLAFIHHVGAFGSTAEKGCLVQA